MASASYTARRGLVSGHVAESTYSIDMDLESVSRPSGDDIKVRSESMSGAVETLFFGERRVWTLVVAPVSASSDQALLLLEFLRSTADGQEFFLDPYGTEAEPGLVLSVIREDDGYTEDVFVALDGVGSFVRFTFRVREV
jgi:hypothetical protein